MLQLSSFFVDVKNEYFVPFRLRQVVGTYKNNPVTNPKCFRQESPSSPSSTCFSLPSTCFTVELSVVATVDTVQDNVIVDFPPYLLRALKSQL